ncbi:hypothetical protein ACWC1D_27530 [Streptomyces sp. NPDC001478]
MTAAEDFPTRAHLADLLTEAAHSVSGIVTAEYPTTVRRSYLYPVLGPLAAGPAVISELNVRLEELLAARPRPVTPAGLFALASYASALGWLTESFTELTVVADRICTRADTPAGARTPAAAGSKGARWDNAFTASERAAIRSAATPAGLAPGTYVEGLSESLLAAARFAVACAEISDGLLDDAAFVLDDASDDVRTDDGPNGLPTLVRSLLARMETSQ